MKLIIDISEETYKEIRLYGLSLPPAYSLDLAKALKKAKELKINDIDSDLIERKVLLEKLKKYSMVTYIEDVRRIVESLPSAETKWIPTSERLPEEDGDYIVIEATYMLPSAERKGRWFDYVDWCKCSVCKTTQSAKTKYCPNCGAKMEADE